MRQVRQCPPEIQSFDPPSDAELLADWLRHKREPAFQAIVARYAGLVHTAAKRSCGDETLTAEASQLAFILLARKAK